MITEVSAFLSWFEGVHRRTLRDVLLLPPEAQTWTPPAGEGEISWGIPRIVQHTGEARLYFGSAFAGHGWVWDPWPDEVTDRDSSARALEDSLEQLRQQVEAAGDDRLRTKIELIGASDHQISGWRALMMMAEHEVHHRAQISTYAGLNGWPVAQTFDRTNEWVVAQREEELRRRGQE